MDSLDTFDALRPVTHQAVFEILEADWWEADGMWVADMVDKEGKDITVSVLTDDASVITLLDYENKYGTFGEDFEVNSLYDLRCFKLKHGLTKTD